MKSHATGHSSHGRFQSVDGAVALATHLSVVQTAVAAAKVAFAMALLSVWHPLPPLVGGLMAFALYTVNNLADVDEDAVNKPACAAVTVRYRRELAAASGLAAAGAIALAAVAGGWLAVAVVAVPVLASVAYSVPVPLAGHRRLKDVFALNTTLVAAAWALPLTYLPVVVAGGVPLAVSVPVCLLLFCQTFVAVEVFNVRDVAGDRASGVSTLPVALGVDATAHLLLVVDVIGLALLVALGAHAPPLLLAAAVVATAVSMTLTLALQHSDAIHRLCLAKDGQFLTLGVVALLVI